MKYKKYKSLENRLRHIIRQVLFPRRQLCIDGVGIQTVTGPAWRTTLKTPVRRHGYRTGFRKTLDVSRA